MSQHQVRARSPLGESGLLDREEGADVVAAFLEDAAHVPGGYADGLLRPRSEREVADALASCRSVLTIGAQSSLTGGATPRGDTLLSTSRLHTLENLADGRLRVGAGVTIAAIDAWLERRGALYPPGPTWQGATLGGTIATNAAGAATFKYGSTRRWVDELTVVLASGDVLDLRRGETRAHPDGYVDVVLSRGTVRVPVPTYRMPEVLKLSAGYYAAPGMDLIDLFIGSEGTLGVVTEATLRVERVRPASCLAFVSFADRRSALACVDRLREVSRDTWASQAPGLDVSAIEHLDARSLALLREDGVDARLGVGLDPGAALALLVAVDLPAGTTASDAYAQLALDDGAAVGNPPLAQLAGLLRSFDVLDQTLIAVPGDRSTTDRLLALREAVPVAVNARVGVARRDVDRRIEKTAADVIVPVARFGEMLDCYEHEWRRRGLDGAIWGHISDGNVHPNVIPRSFDDVVSGREAVLAFGREAIRLGGAPLAEHGVGRSAMKQQLLRELYGDEGVEQMRRVKRALDPRGVLAPGVIFPVLS